MSKDALPVYNIINLRLVEESRRLEKAKDSNTGNLRNAKEGPKVRRVLRKAEGNIMKPVDKRK